MEDRQMQNALLINKLAKSHGIKFTQVDKKKMCNLELWRLT